LTTPPTLSLELTATVLSMVLNYLGDLAVENMGKLLNSLGFHRNKCAGGTGTGVPLS
jgi:hypothetical protein